MRVCDWLRLAVLILFTCTDGNTQGSGTYVMSCMYCDVNADCVFMGYYGFRCDCRQPHYLGDGRLCYQARPTKSSNTIYPKPSFILDLYPFAQLRNASYPLYISSALQPARMRSTTLPPTQNLVATTPPRFALTGNADIPKKSSSIFKLLLNHYYSAKPSAYIQPTTTTPRNSNYNQPRPSTSFPPTTLPPTLPSTLPPTTAATTSDAQIIDMQTNQFTGPPVTNNPDLPYPYPTDRQLPGGDPYPNPDLENEITDFGGDPYVFPNDQLGYPFPADELGNETPDTESSVVPFPYDPFDLPNVINNGNLPYPYPTPTDFTNNPNLPTPYPPNTNVPNPNQPDSPYPPVTDYPDYNNPDSNISEPNNPDLPTPYPLDPNNPDPNNPNIPNPYPLDPSNPDSKTPDLPTPYPADPSNPDSSNPDNNIPTLPPPYPPQPNNPDPNNTSLPTPYPPDPTNPDPNNFDHNSTDPTTTIGSLGSTSFPFTYNPDLPYPYPTEIEDDATTAAAEVTTSSPVEDTTVGGLSSSPSIDAVTTTESQEEQCTEQEASCGVAPSNLTVPGVCGSEPVIQNRCNGSCTTCQNEQPTVTCCQLLTYQNAVFSCAGQSVDYISVDSCACAQCEIKPHILKGHVMSFDKSQNVRLAEIVMNNKQVGLTDFQGYFTLYLPPPVTNISLTIIDNTFGKYAPITTSVSIRMDSKFIHGEFLVPEQQITRPAILDDSSSLKVASARYMEELRKSSIPREDAGKYFGQFLTKDSSWLLFCKVFGLAGVSNVTDVALNTTDCILDQESGFMLWQLKDGLWEEVDSCLITAHASHTQLDWLMDAKQDFTWYAIGKPANATCTISLEITDTALASTYPYHIQLTHVPAPSSRLLWHGSWVLEHAQCVPVPCGQTRIRVERFTRMRVTSTLVEAGNVDCDVTADVTLPLQTEQTETSWRYLLAPGRAQLGALALEDLQLAWHPLAYKDAFSACFMSVTVSCQTQVDIVAYSRAPSGRLYGMTSSSVRAGEKSALCLEFKCSGLDVTESSVQFTRLVVEAVGSPKCQLTKINTALSDKFSSNGILLPYFVSEMPMDAYGDRYGVYIGTSSLAVEDAYRQGHAQCHSSITSSTNNVIGSRLTSSSPALQFSDDNKNTVNFNFG